MTRETPMTNRLTDELARDAGTRLLARIAAGRAPGDELDAARDAGGRPRAGHR